MGHYSLFAAGLLGLVILASRIPFIIGTGYGLDDDASRIVLAGRTIWTGHYAASRPPSYPAVEFVAAILGGSQPWVMTAATALVSAVGCALFALLLHRLEVRAWAALAVGMSMTPVVYLSSTTAMDYVWSSTFLIAAAYCLTESRFILVGVFAGLALASRPATVALLPLLIGGFCRWRAQQSRRVEVDWRNLLRASAAASVTVVLLFLPGLVTFGRAIMHAYPKRLTRTRIVEEATFGVWGAIGLTAVVIGALSGLVFWLLRRRQLTVETGRGQTLWLAGGLTAITVQLVAFWLLPADPAYLVGLVPVVLLCIGLTAPPLVSGAVALALTVAAFVEPVVPHAPATVQADAAMRRRTTVAFASVAARVRHLPAGALVVAGPSMPTLLLALHVLPAPSSDTGGHTSRTMISTGVTIVYEPTEADLNRRVVYAVGAGRFFVPPSPAHMKVLH